MIATKASGEGGALSDEAVVARVLEGETALYEVLMRRHNQKVYRTVRSVLGSDSESEDVMQHAYLAAYAHLAQLRGGARFSPWLLRIAVHEALARLRTRQRFVLLAGDEPGSLSAVTEWEEPAMAHAHDPEQAAQSRELGLTLDSLIADLPVKLRTVFVLREVEGLSTSEVAHALELSDDNVKARLHRAKVALREALTQRIGIAAVQAWRFEAPRCDRVVGTVMACLGGDPKGA